MRFRKGGVFLSLAHKGHSLEHASFPIRFEQVSFGYGQKPVLTGLSYAFGMHTVTAVLGKSGSGKSTLLELINGMVVPTQGRVVLLDHALDYGQLNTLRRSMGYVVQNTGLFPHLTIHKNIGLPGIINGLPAAAIHKRVGELMELVQLDGGYADKYPHALSGGEQQRVSLCRAMFMDPPVLLMDEPFSSLDYSTKHHIYAHFQRLQREAPRTVVLVTHDWEEAKLLADAFVWVDDTQIRAMGTRADLDMVKDAYLQRI